VAITGKMAGSAIAAHSTGMSWRESWAIGTLMNTRGLMELVILNVGLDIGVLSPALFAMMVIMALVTTFMTSPVLELIYPRRLFTVGEEPMLARPPRESLAPGNPGVGRTLTPPLQPFGSIRRLYI